MVDYSFFALLFAIATALAPGSAREVSLVNARHPTQSIVFTRGGDGLWAMTMNGRDVGRFQREGDTIVHHTGVEEADRHPLAELARPEDLRSDARRVRLAGRFAPTTLQIAREGGRVELVDPSEVLLVTRLILQHAREPRAPSAPRP